MAQVLKEELRLAILRAAQNEFLEYGYLLSSVKRIAAKVGISAGNLYRYYDGKEALFDSVVNPVYAELEGVIGANGEDSLTEGDVFDLVVNTLMSLIEGFREPLLILIDGSKGTRHEDGVLKLHKMMADHVTEHLIAYNSRQSGEVYTEQVSWPIGVAFMQGYFEIIRRCPDPKDCRSVLSQYVSFWYQGLRSFV
ncbi:TetR/AcrR family transcriptional regulator [Paenibacillus sp. J5C_2022]|uniref:TetR/AcrR family transcriptional regulator n=1 Tax=Paenibacillus sp. J5C2022 TaxID=2977129 RepID=UPI0021D0FFC1|nr:TetR/AcrR family transcriptional regulator [Paenibacillus sp. J5C2022]MCU6711375.1 TetR/AcrR family transcriptional regulator [Paenibacillus sp. J5C2022]